MARGIDVISCTRKGIVHNGSDQPSVDWTRITMTNLLDERIDQHLSMYRTCGTEWCVPYSAQYKGIANTIVQLICRSTAGVIAPSQPILSEEQHFERRAWAHRSPVGRNR